MNEKPFDLIIVGASAAGVAAAIYAARRKLNFIVLATDIGGEVATSGEIENYPGFVHTDGVALAERFQEQLTYNKVDIRWPMTVSSVKKDGALFTVVAEGVNGRETFQAKAVIVASGMHPKHLGVPGEKEFRGHGITYCTTCDGPLFKGKNVVTIGGGNSALESGLMLSELASRVTVINKNPFFKGETVLIDKLKAKPNVTILYNAKTVAIRGKQRTTSVEYHDANGQRQSLPADGVFIHIGNLPNSTMVDVEKNKAGAIVIDAKTQTSQPGLFAAGDVATVPYWQIGIAVGTGITAALSAIEYINRMKD